MHEDHAMLIEEPEVHLHPDLQRKLLRFIIAETRNTYFVSTHSNVFLDAAKDVDVYHVKYDHLASRVVPSIAAGASRELLEDMGYKASDLLQVNGIIWVEGPSDRTYINKWISLTNPELIEGIHYAVMFFGGGTVSHISGDQDKIDNLVNLKKINPNAFVVLDSDRASDDDQLSEDARRLQNEFNAACWITAGKTIENYLPVDLVRSCFSEDIENDVKFTIGQYDDVIKTLNSIPGRRKSTRKTICAKLFCSRMSSGDLDILDLRFSIQKIVNHIMHWNLTDVPSADS